MIRSTRAKIKQRARVCALLSLLTSELLSTEVIEADVCVIDAQRVEQVEDGIRFDNFWG